MATRTFIPTQLLKLSATYDLPFIPDLRIGGVVKWQDDISIADGDIRQEAYTLVDLAMHYQILESLSLSLNVENVTDEKYLSSLYWDQAFYGAPRNTSSSVRWKF